MSNLFKNPIDLLRHYLADIVYGATDGIITTFAIVSGVEGAKLSPIVVIILGVVNLFADGISMGASSFLSFRAGAVTHNIKHSVQIPFKHSLTTFLSFVIFGGIPLISFLIPGFFEHKFLISCIMTTFALIVIGTLRAMVAKERWFQGVVEMLLIGGSAAFIAYGLGVLLSPLTQ